MSLIYRRKQAIFFYDGECGFCNATVMFLLDRTSFNTLLFCKLQSEFARNFFIQHNYPQPDLTTAYLYHRDRLFQKSSAILKAVSLANKPVKYLQIFLAVPKFIRDSIYNLVSRLRQQIKIGKKNCRLLTPQERQRFIEI
ncbi:DUF393 domain-containing protein [Waterburya agarophytonicola K14]|uniref:DUF393 domain-containing protein n=1 Tax=Waterburya agarophytonicola KI4 TaxID=2874699 RepID=A0A964BQV2_9CYAN|nr:DCC1-like thiol-disulfide oxidoreductase family protein [Waterburya agarophytonicola]MCC0177963.1 DUF393 domain-containing protein [Waterburya agarophytonicola KI4]